MTAKGKAVISYGAKLDASYKRTVSKIRAANDRLKKAGATAFSFGAKSAAVGMVAVGAATAVAIKNAATYQKTLGKFNVVFSKTNDQALAWADAFQKATGESREGVTRMAADLGDLLKPLGFAEDKALQMSQTVVGLVADLASFNGTDATDVMRDMQSILSGSSKPALKYGVVMKQAQVNAELMAMGIKKGSTAATSQQMVLARLNLLMKGTTDAQGAAARDGGKWANQTGRLTARMENLAATVGTKLIPIFGPWLDRISDVIDRNESLIGQKVGDFIQGISEKATSLLEEMGGLAGITEKATAHYTAFQARMEQLQPFMESVAATASFMITMFKEGVGAIADFGMTTYALGKGAIEPTIEYFKTLIVYGKTLFFKVVSPLAKGVAKLGSAFGLITDNQLGNVNRNLDTASDFNQVRDQAERARTAQSNFGTVAAEQLDAFAGRNEGRGDRIRSSAINNYGAGKGLGGVADAAAKAAEAQNAEVIRAINDGVASGVNRANKIAATRSAQNIEFAST